MPQRNLGLLSLTGIYNVFDISRNVSIKHANPEHCGTYTSHAN